MNNRTQNYSNCYTLIVDDQASMRNVIKSCIQDLGITKIREAVNGAEALKLFRSMQMFTLIICDWNMPKMDGLELLKTLRPNRLDRSFRFILVTAENNPKKLREAIALGVDDVISKPFQMSQLSECIASLVNNTIAFPIPLNTLKVVIVDDSKSMLGLLKGLIAEMGFTQIQAFESAAEASDYIKKEKVDMILSDWHMPDMDGLAFFQSLQTKPRTRHIPFILLTVDEDITHIRQAIDLGIHGYLIKPFHFDSICREIARILRLSLQ